MFGSVHRRVHRATALAPDAPEGELRRVTGAIHTFDGFLRAPRSGRVCVAFSIHITEPARPQGAYASGSARITSVETRKFAVEFDGGFVFVDSQFAELDLPYERFDDPSADNEAWASFCDQRRVSPISTGSEAIVRPGDVVSIAGIVERRVAAPDLTGYRDGDSQLWLVGDFDRPLLVTRPT